jgi:hypothetical protein
LNDIAYVSQVAHLSFFLQRLDWARASQSAGYLYHYPRRDAYHDTEHKKRTPPNVQSLGVDIFKFNSLCDRA